MSQSPRGIYRDEDRSEDLGFENEQQRSQDSQPEDSADRDFVDADMDIDDDGMGAIIYNNTHYRGHKRGRNDDRSSDFADSDEEARAVARQRLNPDVVPNSQPDASIAEVKLDMPKNSTDFYDNYYGGWDSYLDIFNPKWDEAACNAYITQFIDPNW